MTPLLKQPAQSGRRRPGRGRCGRAQSMRICVAALLVTSWQHLVTAGNNTFVVVIVVLEVCRGELDPRRSFLSHGGVRARDYRRGAVGAAAETVDECSLR